MLHQFQLGPLIVGPREIIHGELGQYDPSINRLELTIARYERIGHKPTPHNFNRAHQHQRQTRTM